LVSKTTSFNHKKILITCGPTWVAIDAMRVISNTSTGTLGQVLAETFAQKGAKVTLLQGPVLKPLESQTIKIRNFKFYDELFALLKNELKKPYDVVIHAAAVSDYKPKQVLKGKMSSNLKTVCLNLIQTGKMIQTIKPMNSDVILVGFKLEPALSAQKAIVACRNLFATSKCDLVVANCLNGGKYHGFIIDNKKTILAEVNSRNQLSQALAQTIKERLTKIR
jgi:phosphopantothenoylcysteine decarboxylase / phosphopantothenate---cysteine ligase